MEKFKIWKVVYILIRKCLLATHCPPPYIFLRTIWKVLWYIVSNVNASCFCILKSFNVHMGKEFLHWWIYCFSMKGEWRKIALTMLVFLFELLLNYDSIIFVCFSTRACEIVFRIFWDHYHKYSHATFFTHKPNRLYSLSTK